MKAKNSTVYVNRTIGKANDMPEPEGEGDVIAVHNFATEPASVTVDYHLTMNLGNFESARIGVSVQVPCYKEEIDDAYEFAAAWAEERIGKERDMITGKSDDTSDPL